MRAGSLRYRILIEQLAEQRDSYGAEVKSWYPFANVWASCESITGREFFSSAQVSSTVTTKFGIRSLDGVTTKMRVSFDGYLYNIVAILDSEKKADLVLLCEKVART